MGKNEPSGGNICETLPAAPNDGDALVAIAAASGSQGVQRLVDVVRGWYKLRAGRPPPNTRCCRAQRAPWVSWPFS